MKKLRKNNYKMSFCTQNLDNSRPLSSYDLDLSKEEVAYQKAIFAYQSDLINEFNYMVDKIIPGILKRKFYEKDNIYDVKDVSVKFPRFSKTSGTHIATPRICRDVCATYECDIYIDYVISSKDNVNGISNNSIQTKKIGAIHCMVGSNRCYTSNKPPDFRSMDEWKMFLGECPASPAAFYINLGGEKFLINDEKLRTNTYIIFMTGGDYPHIEGRITSLNSCETTLVRLEIGKHTPSVKVRFPHLKGKHYPLYVTFYLLNLTYNNSSAIKTDFDIDGFENRIADFAKREHHEKIKAYLETSKIKFIKMFMVLLQDGRRIINEDSILAYCTKKLSDKSTFITNDNAKSFTMSSISNDIPKEMFVGCHTYSEKLINLCYFTCQVVVRALGLRDFSSRDSWETKKIDTSIKKITHYVSTKLCNAVTTMSDKENISLGKGDKSELIIETRKSETINSAIGERDKINTQVDPRTNSKTLREVSQGQIPFICPVKTPEGETCGLSKEKAILTHLSYNREFEENRKLPITDIFEESIYYVSNIQTEVFAYQVFFVNINNNKNIVYLSHEGRDQYAFFSKRIISLFKELIDSGKVIYTVDSGVIYFKWMEDDQFFSTGGIAWNGYKLNCVIPQQLLQIMGTALTSVKNPYYTIYSSFTMSDACKYKFAVQYNNQTFNIQSGSNYLYISDRFVAKLKAKLLTGDELVIVGDTCFLRAKKYDVLLNIRKDHWSNVDINIIKTPKEYAVTINLLLTTMTEMVAMKINSTQKYAFSFNGNLLCSPYNKTFHYTNVWINPSKMFSYLKECRKNGSLPMDCCIYKNDNDFIIELYDDSGRVMAPLLTVDENGDLEIDKLNSWDRLNNKDFSISEQQIASLYKEGSLELIDAKEMDTVTIARSVDECRRIGKLRKFLNSINITQIQSSIIKAEDGSLINEDVIDVNIHNNKMNVEYTLTEPEFDCHKYTDDEVTYYGLYSFNLDVYNEYPEVIYTLNRPENGMKIDGMYMLYFKDNQYHFILKTDDFEVDYLQNTNRKVVIIDEQEYLIEYLSFPKGVDTIYRGRNLIKRDVVKFTRPVNLAVNKKYYLVNDIFYGEESLIDKHFIEVDGKFHIATVVNFPEEKNIAFFELNDSVSNKSPVINKITEYIPVNVEPRKFLYVEKDEEIDTRECNLYMANIRRYISDLDVIDLSLDPNYILEELKKNIPELGNRGILKKLRKYLNKEFKFTHALLDPNQVYSAIANLVPKADSNPGPRFTYQCAMGTQALGCNNSIWYTRYETSHKRLISPVQHLFETPAELPLNQCTMSTTQNMVIANLAHRKGFEDPSIISKSAAESFGIYDKEICITVTELRNGGKSGEEIVKFPTDIEGNPKNHEKYSKIEKNGLPILGKYIKEGDCIVGKIKQEEGKYLDVSHIAEIGDEGIVTDIKITSSETGNSLFRIITIKLKQYRHQQPGDKMASRYSQKGTIADIIEGMILEGDERLKIVDDNKMPYVRGGPNHGLRCDIIFNPASFPSRMTCGLIKEILTVKAGYYIQKKINATNHRDLDLDYYSEMLYQNGMDYNGNELLNHSDGEIMIDSTSGKPFQAFIGVVAYQFLKHHVIDKTSVRFTGNVKPTTQQPDEGRSKGGGQRFGEMERDAVLSSGAGNTLYDRFMVASDFYTDVFCTNCKNNSSMSDLERKVCHICRRSGTLVSVSSTRIYTVFCLQMQAIGCGIKHFLEPIDSFEEESYKRQLNN